MDNFLKLRTTKAVGVSFHTDEERKVEFRYRYERDTQTRMIVKVDAYKIIDADTVELIQGGSRYDPPIEGETLQTLLAQSEANTPLRTVNESALDYFDRLIATGIKLVIISEHLWKGKLTISDFE